MPTGGIAPRRRSWLSPLAVVGALALIVSLLGYARRGSGIDHTAGALLVSASSGLLLLAAVALALTPRSGTLLRWGRRLLLAAALFDILGTALAGWLLHAWLLCGLMAAALVGWASVLSQGLADDVEREDTAAAGARRVA